MNKFAYNPNAKHGQQMFQFYGKGKYITEVLKSLLEKEKADAQKQSA